jgi:hypothetical protein
MSRYSGGKGYHDGRENRRYREPNDMFDFLVSSVKENRQQSRENDEYREEYQKGQEDRRRRRYR